MMFLVKVATVIVKNHEILNYKYKYKRIRYLILSYNNFKNPIDKR